MMKSPGQQITNVLLEHPERRRFEIDIDRKAILAFPGTPATISRVIPGPVLPLRMRNLIPASNTVGSGIIYVRETSFTDSVITTVPAGNLKPTSNLTYEVVQQPVTTVAAYLKLPDQYWQDFFGMFEAWIDSRLLYGLSEAEEYQLLNGDGTGSNLQGLMLVAMPVGAVATGLLAGIAAGIAAVYGRGYVPTGIVVNPADWGKVLTADAYAIGSPALLTAPIGLWGVPVVVSKAMAAGSFLVGQFDPYCQIVDREDAAVEVADQNEDDFLKNLDTIRAEERLAFAIYQPGAFAKGTFT